MSRANIGINTLAAMILGLGLNCGVAMAQNPGDCVIEDGAFASQDGGCKDLATGKVWSQSMGYYSMGSWDFAKTYCSNLVEGGQADWRMPTLNELMDVSNNGANGHLNAYNYTWKWTSTTPKGAKNAYAVNWLDSNGADFIHYTSWGKGAGWDTVCVRP